MIVVRFLTGDPSADDMIRDARVLDKIEVPDGYLRISWDRVKDDNFYSDRLFLTIAVVSKTLGIEDFRGLSTRIQEVTKGTLLENANIVLWRTDSLKELDELKQSEYTIKKIGKEDV